MDFVELNAQRGLSPRQQRLLSLQALFENTHYDDLEDWSAVDSKSEPLPCEKRKPDVLLGFASEKARELVRLLSGEKGRPQIEGVENIRAALDDIRLERIMPLAVLDGVVKGACAIAVHRPRPDGRWEAMPLQPEWSEVIFVAHVRSERARQIAEELQALKVPMLQPRGMDALFAPEDANSHAPAFVRYEWVRDEEVANRHGGAATTTVRWRYRRDYLPNVIVEYVPVRIIESDDTVKRWELAGRPRPHNWGVVPVSWARAPYARPGASEGDSFFDPVVRSCARKADYVESMAGESVMKIAWPQLALIDLKDKQQEIDETIGRVGRAKQSSSSRYVLELKSSGGAPGTGKAEVLAIDEAGPKVAADYVGRLHRRIEQVTGLEDFDQSEAAGTMSGQALERIMGPRIETVGEWRTMGEDLLIGLCLILGTVLKVEVKPKVRWPRVVETTPQDLTAAAQALTTANGGQPVMSTETAIRIFAQLANVSDVEAELKAVQGEVEEVVERERQALARMRAADEATETAPAEA